MSAIKKSSQIEEKFHFPRLVWCEIFCVLLCTGNQCVPIREQLALLDQNQNPDPGHTEYKSNWAYEYRQEISGTKLEKAITVYCHQDSPSLPSSLCILTITSWWNSDVCQLHHFNNARLIKVRKPLLGDSCVFEHKFDIVLLWTK